MRLFFRLNMFKYYILVLVTIFAEDVNCLDNGLALTPPMGWMHWQRFRCLVDCDAYPDECISEKLFRDMADRLAEDGFKEVGYEYIIIDDCWASKERDENERLQPDPIRFPSGIKALADYVHSKGLKFGIYGDFGTKTCAGYPGSINYLEQDAKTWAEWGVDYLKLDGCYADEKIMEEGYAKMGRYLNQTGRPIVYSCSWPAYQEPLGIKSNYSALQETCNLWRNWDDIDDGWANVTSILKWFSNNQDRIAPFSGPGHWNDPDMLLIGNFGLSYEQSKAQMAIWAVMAAPLIMSVDLRTIEPKFKEILLNKDIIRVNQDPLGIQGKLVLTKSKIDIWTKPIVPDVNGSQSYAIGIISNRFDGYRYRLNFTLAELNINSQYKYVVTDLYENKEPSKEVGINDLIFVRVAPTGGTLLQVTPSVEL
ncbi:alpha-N-acetylgalactosaminidase-like isoform X1 [Aethina tumida]|uniref:alpha-N-acetylgalactosaminidase-like isoform X1 n=2 Tax=Aethina tumida TaxID=116153 RepID=UPI00096B667F|nr:alpha-N-acetylgalactosaminidase-like isoform X1 [Aethina tumida]